MNIGYARVSTLDQNLDLQMQALRKADCKKIFREKVSGTSRERPEFRRMLDQLRHGDTVIVWKLDRLARSTRTSWRRWRLYAKPGPAFSRCPNPGRIPLLMQAS
jgi:DNA invertase Pin-like site-specific DNA recombinase